MSEFKSFRGKWLAAAIAGVLANGLMAQDDDASASAEAAASKDEAKLELQEITVTGSRIRRDEFSSVAPIQILDGAFSREVGLIDTAAILQSTSQATGQQIDNTFSAFVLDNGPGSSQVNLRGLGPERVLVMLNSKRLAPAGVGGAPTSPDLNTIPSIMVDRVDLLLDGASSVYGSDAVSGVANVIMRRDFDGFEIEGNATQPSESGGEETAVAFAWGKTTDKSNFGIGVEYYDRKTIKLRDRKFTSQCDRFLYEDENGRPVSNDTSLVPGTTIDPCKLTTINRVFIPVGYGNVWYTPGTTNINIPNFSETELPVGFAAFNPTINPIDIDGDGIPDTAVVDPDGNGLTEVDLKSSQYNFNGSEADRAGDLLTGLKRFNLYAYGEHEFSSNTLYYELLYSRRETDLYAPGASIFPDVPEDNPYNPCNQSGFGTNCLDFFGFNFGNLEVTPIVVIRGDRDRNDVKIDQTRLVVGTTGDLPGWSNDSGFGNWSYDAYVSHSFSKGTDRQRGILEAELNFSLQTSMIHPVTGEVVCGTDADNDGIPDGADCVPVNMFAASIYQPGGGTFATQAETDYLFGDRTFKTEVDQTIASLVVQGEVATLPWNNTPIPLVLGAEFRRDAIDSIPNDVARDGLLIAFFKDGGAKGSRNIKELFIETEFQLIEQNRWAKELSLNLAGRWTDESTYGSDTTYSIKTMYTPVDGISFRGTYGTSFRAPNAREQFLVGQSGFVAIADPCVVPTDARIPAINPNDPDVYDPTNDTRSQLTLDNCAANGVDPTALGLDGGQSTYSVEVLRKGGQQVQLNIDPETSTSYTYGVVLEQTWSDNFDLRFGMTYYDIEVENSISLLGTQFVISDCYSESANNSSGFCRFIQRDADGFIDTVDSSFVNVNRETARGIDYNLYFEKDFVVSDRNLNVSLDVRYSRLLENLFEFEEASEDDAGTPIAPGSEGTFVLRAEYQDYSVNWRASFIEGEQDENADFDEYEPCTNAALLCRPRAYTDDVWVHTLSATWAPNDFEVTLGVRNLFDEQPSLLDGDVPETQYNNLPLGVGYDVFGRSYFAAMKYKF